MGHNQNLVLVQEVVLVLEMVEPVLEAMVAVLALARIRDGPWSRAYKRCVCGGTQYRNDQPCSTSGLLLEHTQHCA